MPDVFLIPYEPVRALIATVMGMAPTRVNWDGEAEKTLGPINGKSGKVTLSAIARSTNGTLEPRRVLNEGTNELQETYGAHRTVTIQIRFDAFQGYGNADDILELARLRLALPKNRASLRAAGLAFIEAISIVPLDYNVDTRAVASASLDLIVAQLVKVTSDPIPWVEKVSSKSSADVDPPHEPDVYLRSTTIE